MEGPEAGTAAQAAASSLMDGVSESAAGLVGALQTGAARAAETLGATGKTESSLMHRGSGQQPMDAVAEWLPYLVPVVGGIVLLSGVRWLLGSRLGSSAGRLLCVPLLALCLGLLSSDEAESQMRQLLSAAWALSDLFKLSLATAFFCAAYLMADLSFGRGGSGDRQRRRDVYRRYPKKLPAGRREAFQALLPAVFESITEELAPRFDLPQDIYDYIKALLDYNVPGGHLDRGIMVLECLEQFEHARRFHGLGHEGRCEAVVLGWCVEILQASFFVADDVMSGANMRRAQPCWHKRPDVAQNAVNDAVLLKSFVFRVLQRHFGRKAYFSQLHELFTTVVYETHLGVLLYLTRQSYTSPKDLSRFTEDRWRNIAKYRIAMYSVYLPISIGMVVNGITEVDAFRQLERVSAQMGEYIQAHEDYLSCLDPRGRRSGGDISASKCTWLIVKALQKAGMDQRRTLQQNYGVLDPVAVQTVRQLYTALGLTGDFHVYEEDAYRSIKKSIKSAALRELPRGLFDTVLGAIFNTKTSGDVALEKQEPDKPL